VRVRVRDCVMVGDFVRVRVRVFVADFLTVGERVRLGFFVAVRVLVRLFVRVPISNVVADVRKEIEENKGTAANALAVETWIHPNVMRPTIDTVNKKRLIVDPFQTGNTVCSPC
jgi:hypothetical protein